MPVTRFEGKIKQGMCSWFPGPWGVDTPSLCCCQLCPVGQADPTLLPTRLCTGPGTGLPGAGLPAPGVSPPARMVPQCIIWHNCWGLDQYRIQSFGSSKDGYRHCIIDMAEEKR